MNYTVNKLANLSGVSVRTLHYYDEIGLLRPAYTGESGYRYYQEEQLLTLQQILFFRELGFELKQIQKILGQGDLDRIKALHSHKALLQDKILRMKTLMKTIDKTIDHLEGKQMIHNKEIFKGFEPDSEQQKKYEKLAEEYLIDKYGNIKAQEIFAQTNKNSKTLTKQDWQNMREEGTEICNELVLMIEKHFKPDSQEVQQIIRRHYQWIKQFWTPTKETYAGHADFILETDLRKFYDARHPQLAQFIADAIKVFAGQSL